jgi:hypothetical protein
MEVTGRGSHRGVQDATDAAGATDLHPARNGSSATRRWEPKAPARTRSPASDRHGGQAQVGDHPCRTARNVRGGFVSPLPCLVCLKRGIPTGDTIAWGPHNDDEAEDMRGGGS